MRYAVIVTQIVDDEELDGDDLDYRPEGTHYIEADDEEKALDIFHSTIPISVLEHYEIDVEEEDETGEEKEYKEELKKIENDEDFFKNLDRIKKSTKKKSTKKKSTTTKKRAK